MVINVKIRIGVLEFKFQLRLLCSLLYKCHLFFPIQSLIARLSSNCHNYEFKVVGCGANNSVRINPTLSAKTFTGCHCPRLQKSEMQQQKLQDFSATRGDFLSWRAVFLISVSHMVYHIHRHTFPNIKAFFSYLHTRKYIFSLLMLFFLYKNIYLQFFYMLKFISFEFIYFKIFISISNMLQLLALEIGDPKHPHPIQIEALYVTSIF